MRQQWRKYAARIDALSLRERLMVFAAALAVVVFLGSALFIDPAAARRRILNDQIARQTSEMQALAFQIAELEKKRADPDAANVARRESLRNEIATIDDSLKDMRTSLVPAQDMRGLLQDVLARNPRLQLVSMRTLPVAPLVEKPASAEKPVPADKAVAADKNATPATGGGVYKHGIQITIQGSYSDIHDYLSRLEKLNWRMFWARANLNTDEYPRLTVTVTIYTLSLDKAWLVV
jgi:MSHA biogenesis protein MshJ